MTLCLRFTVENHSLILKCVSKPTSNSKLCTIETCLRAELSIRLWPVKYLVISPATNQSKKDIYIRFSLDVEWTVQCLRTVWFLLMFGRFEVQFLAKITCSDMFEVRFWWFWKKLDLFFINKVREQFGFWWCSRGSKFGFGPKWDVQMCSKFDPLRFRMFEVRFFDVRSTSSNYMCNKDT